MSILNSEGKIFKWPCLWNQVLSHHIDMKINQIIQYFAKLASLTVNINVKFPAHKLSRYTETTPLFLTLGTHTSAYP